MPKWDQDTKIKINSPNMDDFEIKIGDDFRVTKDELNFILEYKSKITKGKNKGDYKWELVGYYDNMALVAEELLDAMPLKSSKMRDDLASVIHVYEDAKTKIIKALK